MANKENTTLRIEPDLKKQAAALFRALGMDLSTATGIFYRQALRYQGFPFEIRLDEPNGETVEAIKEVRRMKADPGLGKTYTNVGQMMEELG